MPSATLLSQTMPARDQREPNPWPLKELASHSIARASRTGGELWRPEKSGRVSMARLTIQPCFGADRLEQLDDVAGGILHEDLLGADAGDDLVAEANSLWAQRVDCAL